MLRQSRLKKTQKIKLSIIFYVLSGAAILANPGCSSDKDTIPEPVLEMTYDGNSTDLKRTVILPTLDTPMPKGKNVIWCSSFQLAWNELKDNVIGEPVKVIGAEEIANRLNHARQSRADISDESCYAAAGLVKDGILEKIRTEMAKRFPSEPKPDFRDVSPNDVIIAYSYLTANVRFTTPYFENNKEFFSGILRETKLPSLLSELDLKIMMLTKNYENKSKSFITLTNRIVTTCWSLRLTCVKTPNLTRLSSQ